MLALSLLPVFLQNRNKTGLGLKIYIKNMVCDRCTLVVSSLMTELNFKPASVEIGEVDFAERELSADELGILKDRLEALGFELIDDKRGQLIDKIKTSIIDLVHRQESLEKIKLSDYLKKNVNYDYNHISHLFSSIEGITIEQYFINHKIEKVKELLVYDELNATEIAYQMGYSSLAHLSGQFKKVTGMTPTQFKKLDGGKIRKSLDKV